MNRFDREKEAHREKQEQAEVGYEAGVEKEGRSSRPKENLGAKGSAGLAGDGSTGAREFEER